MRLTFLTLNRQLRVLAGETFMDTVPSNGPDRLDSWKAITAYLNRDERTVRRWERERGFPIRRVPGGRGNSVFAYRSEIDAWLTSDTANRPDTPIARNPADVTSWPSLSMLAGAGALAAALVAGTVWRGHTAPLSAGDVRLQITPAGVVALDPTGAALWRHAFSPAYITALSEVSEQSHVLAGPHPAVYVTTAHRVRLADGVTLSGELLELGLSDGKPLRSFSFDDHVTFDSTPYDPPWGITAFAVDDSRAPRRLAVASHHFQWSPSLVTILDERFQRHGTYVQSGWIEAVHWMAPNRLMIGGFNHARDGGMLALLDPDALGQAPETPGSHGFCETCGTSPPLRMVVMPRTEVNRITRSRFNRARVQVLPDRIVARTVEVEEKSPEAAADVLYEFTPDLTLIRASFSTSYWEIHRVLEREGKLAHDRDHCPDKDGPREILVWDPETKWKRVTIRSSHPPA
jgi:hypothetical protein